MLDHDPLGPGGRIQVGERCEPLDAGGPVPRPAAAVGLLEVVCERPRVGLFEAEPA
jgi:hypothetical protein